MPRIGWSVRVALLACTLLLPGGRAFAQDAYLLALSWHPAFCETRADRAECRQAERRLVLHGLWPDWDVNGDGKRNDGDAYCVSSESERKKIIALDGGNWLKLPPVKLSQASRNDLQAAMPGAATGLDRHEWWKHGTCSGLEAEDYYATSIALLREVERGNLARLFSDQAGDTLGRKQLLDAFERDFGRNAARALVLDCTKKDGESALAEIRIRLKRTGITDGPISDNLAIPAKAARGDCGANIRIPD